MRIRLKLKEDYGVKRINASNNIDNVIFEEDLTMPENERISIFFKGKSSSGILSFDKSEMEELLNSVKPNMNLIKKPVIKKSSKKKTTKRKKKK